MKICIDNRERTRNPEINRIEKFERFIKSGQTKLIDGIETGNYKVSDYHTADMLIGIEYKRDDFVTSMFDGTLDKQLKELKENFKYPYLFIGYDGTIDLLMNNIGVNPDSIKGELKSILARHHITIMFVGDSLVEYVCGIIERHYDGRTKIKEIEYTPIRKSFLKRDPTDIEIRHAMMEQIPNLGLLKTNHVLEHFDGSIHKVCQATVEDIMQVKGVGETLAKRIKRVLE